MQRANSLSPGLRSNCPPGHSTMGKFAPAHLEALHQGAGAGIAGGVQAAVRLAIAGEKCLQPQHVAAAGMADQDRAALPRFQQADPAQDQGAHQPLAQLGFLHHAHRARTGPESPRRPTSVTATASTIAGRSDNCASSPRNWPGPYSMIAARGAKGAALIDRDPARQHQHQAGRIPPAFMMLLPAGQRRAVPNRPSRPTSRASRVGNIWARRASMVGEVMAKACPQNGGAIIQHHPKGRNHATQGCGARNSSAFSAAASRRAPLPGRSIRRGGAKFRTAPATTMALRSSSPSSSRSRTWPNISFRR